LGIIKEEREEGEEEERGRRGKRGRAVSFYGSIFHLCLFKASPSKPNRSF